MSEDKKMEDFESYEESLEVAANVRMEIEDIHRKAQGRQRVIFEGIFQGHKSNEFNFVKDMLYYTGGYPTENTPARIETFRDQLAAVVKIYDALGLLDNLKSYFAEAGVGIEVAEANDYKGGLFEVPDKTSQNWDTEFFGQKMPQTKQEALGMLMDRAKATQCDICQLSDQVKIAMAQKVEEQFEIKKPAFMKAVEVKVAEKKGKSVEEKLQKIEDDETQLHKALEPFTGADNE